MNKEKSAGIGFFEKYLTIWVLLCMAAGNPDWEVFTRHSNSFGKASICGTEPTYCCPDLDHDFPYDDED